MALININNLTFSYPGSYDNIFEDVSFQIDTAWKLGFIGRNGRGKTTFLNLLRGRYEYSGKISTSTNFEYFPFEVADKTKTTLEIVSSICTTHMYWELVRELSLLEVAEDVLHRPFNTLSPGEQTKVLLATLFLKPSSFLLIDEPTNHLDINARALVAAYLNSKQGFILVSHDRHFLDNCVDHILAINKANIEVQRGNFSSWFANKEGQDKFELAKNLNLQKDIKRLKQAAQQAYKWAENVEKTKIGQGKKSPENRAYVGEKSRRMQQRRKNLESRQAHSLEEKANLLQNIESADKLKISPLPYHTNQLFALQNLTIFYGEQPACKTVNFTIEQGERIALFGKNGCGKSSILKLLCEDNISYQGHLAKGSRLIISYVPQDTSWLHGDFASYAWQNGIDESLFKTILRKFDFSRTQFAKDMGELSAGQKKKVLLAKSLCEQAHIYIWDEPLNFVDIISRIQIERLLLEFKPTILFVEHDRTFCEKIATKVIHL